MDFQMQMAIAMRLVTAMVIHLQMVITTETRSRSAKGLGFPRLTVIAMHWGLEMDSR